MPVQAVKMRSTQVLSTAVHNHHTSPSPAEKGAGREAQFSRTLPLFIQSLSFSLWAGSTLGFHLLSASTLALVIPNCSLGSSSLLPSFHAQNQLCKA